jgi:hypothetical protein
LAFLLDFKRLLFLPLELLDESARAGIHVVVEL